MIIDLVGGTGGSAFTINKNHIFADNTARDSYFALNPTEKEDGILISVGSGFQEYNGANWIEKSPILKGDKGDKGDTGAQGSQGLQGISGKDASEIVSANFIGNDMVFSKDDTTTFSIINAKVSLTPNIDNKQDLLVSGGNIKTISGKTIIGSGDLSITGDDINTSTSTKKMITQPLLDKLSGIESGAEVNDVNSVNGRVGIVVLDADDISDTSTTNKFVTSAEKTNIANSADHIVNTSNPHNTNKSQVGLGNVDNTSDITKFTVSTFSGLNTTDKTIVGAINEADTIKVNEVTNSHLAQMPTMTIKGNNTADTSDPKDLTKAEMQTFIQDTNNRMVPDAKINQWDSASTGVNTGDIIYRTSNTVPSGYLKANGALVSRTTYASLFSIIGTTYGSGDGSTTFNLPDLRGYFVRSWDDGRGVDSGRVLGSTQADQNLAHGHTFTAYGGLNGGGSYYGLSGSGSASTRSVNSSGGSEARPKNIALMAIIKY